MAIHPHVFVEEGGEALHLLANTGGISEYPGGMCGCLSFDTYSEIHGTHPIYAY